MLSSKPVDPGRLHCISCGQVCKGERYPSLPERLFDNLRLQLLSTWSKIEPSRRRPYPAATSPGPDPMTILSRPLPKSIDFTQFEAPSTEVVETHGVVPLIAVPSQKKVCVEPQLTQPIAAKPSISEEYDACINGSHYYNVYSEDEGYDDDCYFENVFRDLDVGEKRCFSFEIQCNIMDGAYFISDFSKLERVEKMGRADPVQHNEIWEAERIVRHVKKPKEGRTLFLVEWAGKQQNGRPWPKTWEPAENLGPVLLHLYETETGLKFTSDE